MKAFMDQDFLLQTETAKTLYHEYAAKMPIIDYHCHIQQKEIYEDRRYDTITQVWLGGDHYKWRAMRSNGVPEYYITGEASDWEKFQKWAETLPKLIGNPLYHWTHLELQRFFGIMEPLNGKNAKEIYDKCNAKLKEENMSVRGLIKQAGVKLICTTDDPIDDLEYHKKLQADATAPAVVLPAFRPDKAMRADKPEFAGYMKELEAVVGYSIDTIADMRKALCERIAYFDSVGCRVSDHALDYCFCRKASDEELTAILLKAKNGEALTVEEQEAYHTDLLITVAGEYTRLKWVMQIHFGCLRNLSLKMYPKLGPDTGFDSMNDMPNAAGLSALLGALEAAQSLPRTVLYSLNAKDDGMIGTILGCFQTDSDIPGKVQQGSAWWFNDHKIGMQNQMQSLMSLGNFGSFVGMLTDSRSFLSYTRHEYFRRILCNLFGNLVENGEYPNDLETLGAIVQDICYNNTEKYFRFDELLK